MNRLNLIFKAAAVGFLTLLLLIPLSMINGTIAERQSYRHQAVDSVAKSYAGPQSLLAPVIIVPYRAEVSVTHTDEHGVARTTTEIQNRRWTYFPKDVQLYGNLVPAIKKRGLHEVRVYEMAASMSGSFDLKIPASDSSGNLLDVGQPFLSFGISDVRGLVGTPRLTLDQRPIVLLQNSGQQRSNGLHAFIGPVPEGDAGHHNFRMEFTLGGTEQFAFVPLADSNHVELKSSWPHPNFDGQFSPRNPQISDKGFAATWDISALASGAQAQYLDGASAIASGTTDANAIPTDATANTLDSLSVTMIEPVNIYSQADRASKYGILFVVLTFVGFFMYELIKRLAIHPIQYLLVGLALAIFFLLLLSLSEHIPFLAAYLIASVACIGLLGVYLSAVLKSRSRGAGFAGMLTLLYAALYGLLVSEDNALVLGSLLLFAILAAIMLITRKIDWYALGQGTSPSLPAAP